MAQINGKKSGVHAHCFLAAGQQNDSTKRPPVMAALFIEKKHLWVWPTFVNKLYKKQLTYFFIVV